MNLTEGALLPKILLFSLPLFGTMLLQLLFNAADLVVVGRYASHQALAAVGATTSLIHLIVNLLVGLSTGTNVVVANDFGAGRKEQLSRTTHTAMLVSILGGILFGAFGFLTARPILALMGTPDDVIGQATLYLKIFFIGLPFLQIYNFGSAILRGVGDTRRPLVYLVISGILNVVLNLLFVARFGMTVDGVALATCISEALSAVLVWRALATTDEGIHLQFRKLAIHGRTFLAIVRIGVPAGVQGMGFSLSNVVIQSAINTFGSVGMAASAAVLSIEGMLYTASCCYHYTAISFAGQNLGARKFDRIRKSFWLCMLCGCTMTTAACWAVFAVGPQSIAIFNSTPEVIAWGMERMKVVFTTYTLLAALDVLSGTLRGLGYSLVNTTLMVVGTCGSRLAWIYFAFPHRRTISFLFLSYPLSWTVCVVAMAIYLAYIVKKTFPRE